MGLVPPPPPPPRPGRSSSSGHARSSSLDLNRLGVRSNSSSSYQNDSRHHNSMSNCHSHPLVPVQPSTVLRNPVSPVLSPGPRDQQTSIHLLDSENLSCGSSHGAFTVYRKEHQSSNQQLQHVDPGSTSPASTSSSTPSSSGSTLDEMIAILRTVYSIPYESFIPRWVIILFRSLANHLVSEQ